MSENTIVYNNTPYKYHINHTFWNTKFPVSTYTLQCGALSEIALRVLTFFMLHQPYSVVQITKVEIGKQVNLAATTVTKAIKELEQAEILCAINEYEWEIQ